MSKIKLLSDDVINQIAAGEIVEKPASALKELIENSIDANAKNIEIFLQNGGKSKIVVTDDGDGLDKEDLKMAIKRHATSKLAGNNLFDISSYGFRGEALPSIASVSMFSIESQGNGVSINYSMESDIFPSPIINGTRVTVQNLFWNTPARLKFLKSDSSELSACLNVVENIALIKSDINLIVKSDKKILLSFKNDNLEERIAKILGQDIFSRAIKIEEHGEHIELSGYLFHPLDNRYSQYFQKIFINGRIVKDKIVSAALRSAYKDLIPAGRFAIAVIYINIDPFHLDANVSPTKSEVRFRDTATVQQFLTEAFKKNMSKFDRVLRQFAEVDIPEYVENEYKANNLIDIKVFPSSQTKVSQLNMKNKNYTNGSLAVKVETNRDIVEQPIIQSITNNISIYGRPIAQIFNAYIITELDDGIIIIDQHAVHEKITQSRMLESINYKNKQYLLKPIIVELTNAELDVANSIINHLDNCGFSIEIIQSSVMISAIPAILNQDVIRQFIGDILSEIGSIHDIEILDYIRKKIADKACHNSIRFGRKLSIDEMNEILNQMENTNSIHQCNHHRPSFIKITKDQLAKMFDR